MLANNTEVNSVYHSSGRAPPPPPPDHGGDSGSYASDEVPKNYSIDDTSDSTGSSLRSLSRELIEEADEQENHNDNISVEVVCQVDKNFEHHLYKNCPPVVEKVTTNAFVPAAAVPSADNFLSSRFRSSPLWNVLEDNAQYAAFYNFLVNSPNINLLFFIRVCNDHKTRTFADAKRRVKFLKLTYTTFLHIFHPSILPRAAEIEQTICNRLAEARKQNDKIDEKSGGSSLCSTSSAARSSKSVAAAAGIGIEIFDEAKLAAWEALETQLRLFRQTDDYCKLQNEKLGYEDSVSSGNATSSIINSSGTTSAIHLQPPPLPRLPPPLPPKPMMTINDYNNSNNIRRQQQSGGQVKLHRTPSSELVTLNEDEMFDASWSPATPATAAAAAAAAAFTNNNVLQDRSAVMRKSQRNGGSASSIPSQYPPPVIHRYAVAAPPAVPNRRITYNKNQAAGNNDVAVYQQQQQQPQNGLISNNNSSNQRSGIAQAYFTNNYCPFTPNSKQPTEISTIQPFASAAAVDIINHRQRTVVDGNVMPLLHHQHQQQRQHQPFVVHQNSLVAYNQQPPPAAGNNVMQREIDPMPKLMYEQNLSMANRIQSGYDHQLIAERDPGKYFNEFILPKLLALQNLISEKGDDARFLRQQSRTAAQQTLRLLDTEMSDQSKRKGKDTKQKIEMLLNYSQNNNNSNMSNRIPTAPASVAAASTVSQSSKSALLNKLLSRTAAASSSTTAMLENDADNVDDDDDDADDILEQHMSASAVFKQQSSGGAAIKAPPPPRPQLQQQQQLQQLPKFQQIQQLQQFQQQQQQQQQQYQQQRQNLPLPPSLLPPSASSAAPPPKSSVVPQFPSVPVRAAPYPFSSPVALPLPNYFPLVAAYHNHASHPPPLPPPLTTAILTMPSSSTLASSTPAAFVGYNNNGLPNYYNPHQQQYMQQQLPCVTTASENQFYYNGGMVGMNSNRVAAANIMTFSSTMPSQYSVVWPHHSMQPQPVPINNAPPIYNGNVMGYYSYQ